MERDVVDQMEHAFALATAVLERVEPDQWAAPTPCEGWTVRDVVNHMVGGAKIVSTELSGQGEGVNYYVNHLRHRDPVDAYRDAAAEAVAVFRADPGLVERTIPMPWGPETGATVATMFMGDHFVHAWDVAKATGQDSDLDPDLAEMLMPFARAYGDRHRGPGMFDDEKPVPAGASAADRLAAVLGRQV
ncbi:MAG TPA: TIGR03086 family metal-binding protein [Acidimicrobiales bacterium]|nr:TIGR03086 family metal-binding protein [Acidimicrobiales bacterium]